MKKGTIITLTALLIFAFFAATPSMASSPAALPDPTLPDDPVDPWAMPFCQTHVGCSKYQVRNQTDGWLQVYLTHGATGEKGFFTIPPKGVGIIQVKPGHHLSTFVYWCDGKMSTKNFGAWWPIVGWIDWFKCPQGYYRSVSP